VGATSEDVGFDPGTTPRGLAALRAIATHAVPVLGHAPLAEHWAGLRPITPDGMPILGVDPTVPALCYACGYSRNGILLAPWAADQLAGLLTGGSPVPALAPFGVERFSRPVP
jgi:glycine/D-amino acid oxidase-like deaminating enzyme